MGAHYPKSVLSLKYFTKLLHTLLHVMYYVRYSVYILLLWLCLFLLFTVENTSATAEPLLSRDIVQLSFAW